MQRLMKAITVPMLVVLALSISSAAMAGETGDPDPANSLSLFEQLLQEFINVVNSLTAPFLGE